MNIHQSISLNEGVNYEWGIFLNQPCFILNKKFIFLKNYFHFNHNAIGSLHQQAFC